MLLRELKLIKDSLLSPEMEIILHPSRRRMQWLGVFTISGHLLFWYIWTQIFPQNFEDGGVRAVLAVTGLGLIFHPRDDACQTPGMRLYFSVVCWSQLPLFFIWMYWMNEASAMWMASVAVMIVIYYQLTDWRMATLGLISGIAVSALWFHKTSGKWPTPPGTHLMVFAFAWISAFLLAISSANLRRERLRHALTVIGIMAHELRTPLATLALIAQAIRSESAENDSQHAHRLQDLAQRIEALTRAINHHIDLQMANARYIKLASSSELVSAKALVQKVVDDYPYASKRERQSVELIVHEDFWFEGSINQFTQVLNNLLKNAFHSLKVAQARYSMGDVCIELGSRDKIGRIQISDKGMGINSSHLSRIFEPFFSTANETGHGLGLAYCKQVVEAAGGSILVSSAPAMGAVFTVQMPCLHPPTSQYVRTEASPLPSP
jgi:two-component system, CAI-1 autoinducer sensor kinase/phosphatase CqsS